MAARAGRAAAVALALLAGAAGCSITPGGMVEATGSGDTAVRLASEFATGTFATEHVAMVVDRVLSDDVVRIVFDTYRTVDAGSATVNALGINQIRVRLYLARRQLTNPDTVLSRMAEATLAMRCRSSGGDMARIAATLGSAPVGVDR